MSSLYWPIALVVASNVVYHISSKSTPADLNPFAALTVTYLVGAVSSAILYFSLNHGGNLLAEYRHLNWSSFALGVAIVGLEAGFIYMYKAGWNISTAQLICSSVLAICLICVGALLYHESISLSKILGVLVCMFGLYLINR